MPTQSPSQLHQRLAERFGEAVGPKNLTVIGAAVAAVSTLMLGLVDGGPLLLVARILWGLAFAGLSLAVLSYAVADKSRAGSRVGVGRSIQQIGPVLALSAGAWLTGIVGPREIFLILGVISLAALPLALFLPTVKNRPERKKTIWLPRPVPLDMFFFVVGFAVDSNDIDELLYEVRNVRLAIGDYINPA